MRIVSFYPKKTFKLIMEFENAEYRLLDVKRFLEKNQGLLKDICNDVNLFLSAELDQTAGTIRFGNDVDFDNTVLYEASYDLEKVIKGFPRPRVSGEFTRLLKYTKVKSSKKMKNY